MTVRSQPLLCEGRSKARQLLIPASASARMAAGPERVGVRVEGAGWISRISDALASVVASPSSV
jgi:hypothetical protein